MAINSKQITMAILVLLLKKGNIVILASFFKLLGLFALFDVQNMQQSCNLFRNIMGKCGK